MPLRAVDQKAGTFDWYCTACSHVHEQCSLDPVAGQLGIYNYDNPNNRVQVSSGVSNFGGMVYRAGLNVTCEQCGATESFRRDMGPWEEGTHLHPDSLVGTELPGGNVIISDHRPGVGINEPLTAEHAHQARLIRMLQSHPLVAALAPPPPNHAQAPLNPFAPNTAQLVQITEVAPQVPQIAPPSLPADTSVSE